MRDYGNRSDAVRYFQKRSGDSGHIEDLKRPGKNRERFRVLRLR